MPNPVVHFEISGKDGKRLQDFYAKLFDWPVQVDANMGGYGMVEAQGERAIGGGISQTMEGAPPSVTFYVMVDDLQASLNKAEKLGGKTIVPPMQISPEIGHFAMFSDPEGNVLGLFKSSRQA